MLGGRKKIEIRLRHGNWEQRADYTDWLWKPTQFYGPSIVETAKFYLERNSPGYHVEVKSASRPIPEPQIP